MMWDGVYQSARCWEFSELTTHAVPEFHVAAFANPDVALKAQDERLRGDQKRGHDDAGLPVETPLGAFVRRSQLSHVLPLAILITRRQKHTLPRI